MQAEKQTAPAMETTTETPVIGVQMMDNDKAGEEEEEERASSPDVDTIDVCLQKRQAGRLTLIHS